MPRMTWRRWLMRPNVWLLIERNRRRLRLAVVYLDGRGWQVETHHGRAGPYGDFDLARQSATTRVRRGS